MLRWLDRRNTFKESSVVEGWLAIAVKAGAVFAAPVVPAVVASIA
jgi:hypothetical protein